MPEPGTPCHGYPENPLRPQGHLAAGSAPLQQTPATGRVARRGLLLGGCVLLRVEEGERKRRVSLIIAQLEVGSGNLTAPALGC